MEKELFEIIYRQNGIEIWVDKKTGVNYVAKTNGENTSITPLLDDDGDVVITPTYIVNPSNIA